MAYLFSNARLKQMYYPYYSKHSCFENKYGCDFQMQDRSLHDGFEVKDVFWEALKVEKLHCKIQLIHYSQKPLSQVKD